MVGDGAVVGQDGTLIGPPTDAGRDAGGVFPADAGRDAASPPARTLRIMPMGDSITHGATAEIAAMVSGGSDRNQHDSYRRPLWGLLAGCDVDFVGSQRTLCGNGEVSGFDGDHEAYCGERADQLLARVQGWAEDATIPDVVLLLIGLNDSAQAYAAGGDGDAIRADIETDLRALILELRRRRGDIVVLLSTYQPWAIREFSTPNEAIRQVGAELGAPVAETFAGFDTVDRMAQTYDGVHPNDAGDALIARGFFEALGRLSLPASSGRRAVCP